MYKKLSIQAWKKYFRDRGLEPSVIEEYLQYIKALNENNAPVIFEFEQLAKLLGIVTPILASMVNAPYAFYRCFEIPKRNGGVREIQAPYPSLLSAQKWIYKNILLQQEVSKHAFGFVKNKSIIENAKCHVGQKAFLKIDIKDFFPSIPKNNVIQTFKKLGYAANVSNYLASLCCLDDALVQGAATSPCLSNLICRHLDKRLSLLASGYDLNYSRYADDIAFSGNYIPHKYISLVTNVVRDCGFHVNEEKTFLSHSKGKRILTGISIAGDTIRIPRNFKRGLRKDVHHVLTHGYFSHVSKKKIRNPFYLESLHGRLMFWSNVEPENKTAIYYQSEIRKIISLING